MWSSRTLGTWYRYRTFNLPGLARNLIWAVLLWCSIFDWLSHSSCLTLLCSVAMLPLASCHIPAQRWVKWFLFILKRLLDALSWQCVNVKDTYPFSIASLKDFQNSSWNLKKKNSFCHSNVGSLMQLFPALLLILWL